MLVLIGSRALQFYARLKDRKPADWDVLYNGLKKREGNIEFHSTRNDVTNNIIYHYCLNYGRNIISTPIGDAIVAPIEVLKFLKLSCKDYLNKAKHEWDLQQMNDVNIPDSLMTILEMRKEETKQRVLKQKDEFFHKYNITRWFDHDLLHEYISNSPAYKNILVDAVNVSQYKFERLTTEEKIRTTREECFVLALERELIPRCKRSPLLVKLHIDRFLKVKTSEDAAYKWLSRLSIPGALKDHPDWLAKWNMENFQLINNGFEDWWKQTVQKLPEHFWEEVLK